MVAAMAEIHLIVMPYELDRLRYGVGRGPEHLLAAGAEAALAAAGADVTTELIELDPDHDNEIDGCFELIGKVAASVRGAREAGAFPVTLSGSCFAGVGVVAGLDEPAPGVVWFDAHGDFNDPATSESGYFDGMPVAVLTGNAWQNLLRAVPGAQPLPETSVVHAGARDFDGPEEESFMASKLVRVAPRRLREEELSASLAELSPSPSGVYVHVDLDVLDGDDGAINVYSAPNGLSEDELEKLVRELLDRPDVRALSLTAYDPECDHAQRVPPLAIRLLEAAAQRA